MESGQAIGLRLARREESALEDAYVAYGPSLLAYLRRYVGPDEAEDVLQRTLLDAWRHASRYQPGHRFSTWLFTIAHRRAVDHARKAIRQRTDPVDGEQFAQRAATNDTAAEGINGVTSREAIDALTAALPSDQAEVVLLRVVAGLDVQEVSQIMGRSPGSVRVLQHRALRRLARRLGSFSDHAVTG